MRLIATDASFRDSMAIRRFGLDLAYGDDENDFTLTVPFGVELKEGCAIYVPETEWGGIIREPWVVKEEGLAWRIYHGHTWHGVMAERILYPDPGDDYLIVSGDANEIIQKMIIRTGLGGLFEAAPACGVNIPRWQFDHDHMYLYDGLRKMLRSFDCVLRVQRGGSGKTMLYAAPLRSTIDDGRGTRYGYQLKRLHPINHLKCLGKGELANRVVVDVYADEMGRVSTTQSIFGVGVREEIYEAANAERDDLLRSGLEHLCDLQLMSEATIVLPEGASYDVDDIVGIDDSDTGISVRSSISKVVVKVSASSVPQVSNQMRDVEILSLGSSKSSIFESAGAAARTFKASMTSNMDSEVVA